MDHARRGENKARPAEAAGHRCRAFGQHLVVRDVSLPSLGRRPGIPALPCRVVCRRTVGITVDHVTIYRRVQRFTPEFREPGRAAMLAGTGGSWTRRT